MPTDPEQAQGSRKLSISRSCISLCDRRALGLASRCQLRHAAIRSMRWAAWCGRSFASREHGVRRSRVALDSGVSASQRRNGHQPQSGPGWTRGSGLGGLFWVELNVMLLISAEEGEPAMETCEKGGQRSAIDGDKSQSRWQPEKRPERRTNQP